LQRRGVPESTASLAADMGMAVFHVGFGDWLDDPAGRELVEIVHEGFDQLKAVASGTLSSFSAASFGSDNIPPYAPRPVQRVML